MHLERELCLNKGMNLIYWTGPLSRIGTIHCCRRRNQRYNTKNKQVWCHLWLHSARWVDETQSAEQTKLGKVNVNVPPVFCML